MQMMEHTEDADDMEDKLYGFLRKRHIPEETIIKLKDEKVNSDVIHLISDEDLGKYLTLGDIAAVRKFYRSETTPAKTTTKNVLFNRLCKRMRLENPTIDCVNDDSRTPKDTARKMLRNQNATKKLIHIEMGWWHNGRSVRATRGGKPRKIPVDKKSTAKTLVEKAKSLFFPSGSSARGLKESSCIFEMKDFCHIKMENNTTVEDVYDATKPLGILRFHLVSHGPDMTQVDENQEATCTSTECTLEPKPQSNANSPVLSDSKDGSDLSTTMSCVRTSSVQTTDLEPKRQLDASSPDHAVLYENIDSNDNIDLSDTIPYVPSSEVTNDFNNIIFGSNDTILEAMRASGLLDESVVNIDEKDVEDKCRSPTVTPSPNDHAELPPLVHNRQANVRNYPGPQGSALGTTIVRLHRVNIRNEMINIFKSPEIMTICIGIKFVDEKGSDADGVSRDAYTAFWDDFFNVCAEGHHEKVPVVYTDYGVEEWNAVGRILAKGLKDVGVFPLQMSESFLTALILGEGAVTPTLLFNSLLGFITPPEKRVVLKALSQEKLDEDEKEDLTDLFCRLGCHSIPTSQEDLRPALIRTAHQNIIQDNKYPLSYMGETAASTLLIHLPDAVAIASMYAAKRPTPKNVIKLIRANPTSGAEEKVLGYLKLYIKSLEEDQITLPRFLRFVTGADILCVDHIDVAFNKTPPGAGRTPIAHTCGPCLDLSTTYAAYRELKSDFTNILQGDCMIMDLV